MQNVLALKQAEYELEIAKKKLQIGLPHLYGKKRYKWQTDFIESTNEMCLLTAANQCGKSSSNIIKCIKWATEKNLWPKLWPTKSKFNHRFSPNFWYVYPSSAVVITEFELKWEKEYLPFGTYKDDPVYGWEIEKDKTGVPFLLRFKSGCTVRFVTQEQKTKNLQAATLDAIFDDEELIEEKYHEFIARGISGEFYFSSVFTATIGQEFWRLAIQPTPEEIANGDEAFPTAFKRTVTLYDCLEYEDGDTNTPFTVEKIQKIKEKFKSQIEIDRRVYGKFVRVSDKKYFEFNRSKALCEPYDIPHDWHYGLAADHGSGGPTGHPFAVVLIAIQPDYKRLAVVDSRMGNKKDRTTELDTFNQARMLASGKFITFKEYDWGSSSFGMVCQQKGEHWEKADKSHTSGEQTVNNLFRMNMVDIFDTQYNRILCDQLETVDNITHKQNAKDDLVDAFRYAVTKRPWDYDVYEAKKPIVTIQFPALNSSQDREDYYNGRGRYESAFDSDRITQEIDDYNNEMEF